MKVQEIVNKMRRQNIHSIIILSLTLTLSIGFLMIGGAVMDGPTSVLAQEDEPDRDPGNLEITDISVEDGNGDGLGVVVAEVQANVNENHYPFKYPTVINFEVIDSQTNEVIESENTSVVLRPSFFGMGTEAPTRAGELGGYTVQTTSSFKLQQEEDTEYIFSVDTRLENNDQISDTATSSQTITGVNERSSANIDGVIQSSTGFRELPTVESVDSYRLSDQNPDYLEELSIPSRETREFSGSVFNFANMTERGSSSATIQSEDGSLTMMTRTQFVEPNEPQNLIIEHNLTGQAEEIEVVVVNSGGEEIDDDRTYLLEDYETEYCQELSESSACAFTLSEEEMDYINQHGDIYVSYESDENAQAEILCQDIVGGGISYTESNVCGLNDIDSEQFSLYEGIITEFTLIDGGDFIEEDGVVRVGDNLEDVTLGVEVENVGTEPIQPDEPVHLFDESSLANSEPNMYTESVNNTDPNGSYTINLSSEYPTSGMELVVNGETNDGSLELDISGSNGQSTTKRINNMSSESVIDLSDLGGYTSSVTVDVESIYSSGEDAPVIEELQVNAVDKDEDSISSIQVSDMTGGTSELSPGETRTHEFASLDLTDLGEAGVSLSSEFNNDEKDLVLEVDSDAEIVADSGGPYTITISDFDEVETEIVGFETIESDTQPGPDWEIVEEDVSGSTSIEYRTSHSNIPEIDADNAEQAIAYWIENDYMLDDPSNLLPQEYQDMYDSGQLDVDVEYQDFRGNQSFVGPQHELSDLDTRPDSWSVTGYSGERLEHGTDRYTIEKGEMVATYDEDNEDVWNLEPSVDDSDAIFFNHISSPTEDIETIEQAVMYRDPTEISDYDECTSSSSGLCWELQDTVGEEGDDSISGSREIQYRFGPEDASGNDEYLECQEPEQELDLGDDWVVAGYGDSIDELDGNCEVEWIRTNTESQTLQEWHLVSYNALYDFHIPQFEEYNEYERALYDIEVVYSYNSSGSTDLWEGPVREFTGDIDEQAITLDGSESQTKSTVDIEEVQWYIDDEAVEGANSLVNEVLISELGEYDIRLEVSGDGITDDDDTQLTVEKDCLNIVECDDGQSGGSDLPEVDSPNGIDYTDDDPLQTYRVDYQYGEIAIETKIDSVTLAGNENYNYELRISPGEAQVVLREGEECTGSLYSPQHDILSEEEETQLELQYNGEFEEPDDRNYYKTCVESNSGTIYPHPDDFSRETIEAEEYAPGAETTFWDGEQIPHTGLRQIAYVNPRLNNAILPTGEDSSESFNITLYAFEEDTNEEIIVEENSVEVKLCEAEQGEIGERDINNMCVDEEAEFDSDMDGNPDYQDECPYDPRFNTLECSFAENEQGSDSGSIQFGSDVWDIDRETGGGSPVLTTLSPYATNTEYYAEQRTNDQSKITYGYDLTPSAGQVDHYLNEDNLVGAWMLTEDLSHNSGFNSQINESLYWTSPQSNLYSDTTYQDIGETDVGENPGQNFYNRQEGLDTDQEIYTYNVTPRIESEGKEFEVGSMNITTETRNNLAEGEAEIYFGFSSREYSLIGTQATVASYIEYSDESYEKIGEVTSSLFLDENYEELPTEITSIDTRIRYNGATPFGGGTTFSGGEYIGLANANFAPGADGTEVNSNIHEMLYNELESSGSYNVSFWYDSTFTIENEKMITQDVPINNSMDTVLATSEDDNILSKDLNDTEFYNALSYDENVTPEELNDRNFAFYTYANFSDVSGSPDEYTNLIYLDANKTSELSQSYVLKYTVDENNTEIFSSEFTYLDENQLSDDTYLESQFEIKSYAPQDEREIISQNSLENDEGLIYELAIDPLREYMDHTSVPGSYKGDPGLVYYEDIQLGTGGSSILAPTNNWVTQEVRTSSIPIQSIRTGDPVDGPVDYKTQAIDFEPYTSNWKLVTIEVDQNNNEVVYLDGHGRTVLSQYGVNEDSSIYSVSSEDIQDAGPNNIEMFKAGGWQMFEDTSWYDSSDRTWYNWSGTMAGLVITSDKQDNGSLPDGTQSELFPENQELLTYDRGVDGGGSSDEVPDTLFTKENIDHSSQISFRGMSPTIRIEAIPTEKYDPNTGERVDIDGEDGYGKYVMRTHTNQVPTCDPDVEPDSPSEFNPSGLVLCWNTLEEEELFTRFKLDVDVSIPNINSIRGGSFEIDEITLESDGDINTETELDINVDSINVDTSDGIEDTSDFEIGEVLPPASSQGIDSDSDTGGGVIFQAELRNNSQSFEPVKVEFRNNDGDVMGSQRMSIGDIAPDGTLVTHKMTWEELAADGYDESKDDSEQYTISVEVYDESIDTEDKQDRLITSSDVDIDELDQDTEFYICPENNMDPCSY